MATEENQQTVFKEESNEQVNESTEIVANKEKTSLGLEPNIAALLAYLVGFITGIIFYIIEKESKFVRFHALQSTITFGGIFIISIVLNIIPIIGLILSLIIGPISLVLWILLMYKAYKGEWFKLPFVGDIVEKQLNQGESMNE